MQAKKGYWTLGRGGQAKKFWVNSNEKGLTFYSGAEGKSITKLTYQQIEDCLRHFADRGWFILGNGIDDIKPGGLGEYLKTPRDRFEGCQSFCSLYGSAGKIGTS